MAPNPLDYSYNAAYVPSPSYNPKKENVGPSISTNAGTPIDLSNSGVLHYLPSDDKAVPKPNKNSGSRKLIMIFGLFGFAVLMSALIGSVVYIQKKKKLNRARDAALRNTT